MRKEIQYFILPLSSSKLNQARLIRREVQFLRRYNIAFSALTAERRRKRFYAKGGLTRSLPWKKNALDYDKTKMCPVSTLISF